MKTCTTTMLLGCTVLLTSLSTPLLADDSSPNVVWSDNQPPAATAAQQQPPQQQSESQAPTQPAPMSFREKLKQKMAAMKQMKAALTQKRAEQETAEPPLQNVPIE